MRGNLKVRYASALIFVFGCAMLTSMTSSLVQRSSPAAAGYALAVPQINGLIDESLDPDWHQVKMILTAKCQRCHRAGTDLPDLTSYEAIVGCKTEAGEPLVVPGQVQESSLWEMANWNHVAQPQSPNVDEPGEPGENAQSWLAGNELAAIERWIRNGAVRLKMPSD